MPCARTYFSTYVTLQVLKTLEQRGTVAKSREEITAFVTAAKSELPLTSEEILQLINHTPTDVLGAYLCLEQALNESRISEDDLDRVVEIVAEHFGQQGQQ